MTEFKLSCDFAALKFVRASCRIPGVSYFAGGAAFTMDGAIARARSERIERIFELTELHPFGIRPAGIAAHPRASQAIQCAYWEAIEDALVTQMAAGTLPSRNLLNFRHFKLGVTKLAPSGWFAFISSNVKGVRLISTAARPTFISAVLKAWEEARNPVFFQTSAKGLAGFSRASKLLGNDEPKFTRQHQPLKSLALSDFESVTHFRDHHYVSYLVPKIKKGAL